MNYNPSDRIKRLRDRVLTNPPERFQKGWWLYYYLKSFLSEDVAKLPLTERHAISYANVINNMPCEIYKEDLLAGEHFDTFELFIGEGEPKDIHKWIDKECIFLPPDKKAELKEMVNKKPFAFKYELPHAGSMYEAFPEIKKANENCVISIWGLLLITLSEVMRKY